MILRCDDVTLANGVLGTLQKSVFSLQRIRGEVPHVDLPEETANFFTGVRRIGTGSLKRVAA